MIKHIWKLITNTKYRETFILQNKIKRNQNLDDVIDNFWRELNKNQNTVEKDTQPK